MKHQKEQRIIIGRSDDNKLSLKSNDSRSSYKTTKRQPNSPAKISDTPQAKGDQDQNIDNIEDLEEEDVNEKNEADDDDDDEDVDAINQPITNSASGSIENEHYQQQKQEKKDILVEAFSKLGFDLKSHEKHYNKPKQDVADEILRKMLDLLPDYRYLTQQFKV